MNAKKLAIATVAIAGALAAATVEARGRDDVQFSLSIGSPFVVQPTPVWGPAFVGRSYDRYHGGYGYQRPTRWDRDGDGIPNRYDRVYNPRWDRDGDGIPNRFDHRDNSRHYRDGRGHSRW
jgi:hypothetical protein